MVSRMTGVELGATLRRGCLSRDLNDETSEEMGKIPPSRGNSKSQSPRGKNESSVFQQGKKGTAVGE